MSYLTLLTCAGILIVSLFVFGIAAAIKKCKIRFIASVCFMVIVFEAVYFMIWPVPNFRFDDVQVKALNAASVEGGGKEVFITGVTVRDKKIDFPEVESGHWFWRNGALSWRPPEDTNQPEGCTDTVVLRVPAGEQRKIVFSSNRWKGLAEITACGNTEICDLYSEEQADAGIAIPDSDLRLRIENAFIRVAVYFCIHIFVLFCAALVCKYLLTKISALIYRWRYEAAFFTYATMIVIRYGALTSPKSFNFTYNLSYYINSYEFGYIGRGLIGQLAMSLIPCISQSQIVWFCRILTLVTIVLICVILGKVVRRQNNEGMRWLLVMIVSTFPSTYMFVVDALRPDIYALLLFICCAILIYKNAFLWTIPFIIFAVMAINETSCFYLVPPILAMLLFKRSQNDVRNKKALFVTFVSSMASAVVMVGLKLFLTDPRLGIGIDKSFSHMIKHLGFDSGTSGGPIYSVTGTLSTLFVFMANKWAQFGKETMLLFLVCIPGCILLCCVWSATYKKWAMGRERAARRQLVCFWLLPLSSLGVLVTFILSCDFGRYLSFFLSANIIMIIWFICENDIQLQLCDVRLSEARDINKAAVPIFPIAVGVFYIFYGVLCVNAEGADMINRIINFTRIFAD